MNQTHHPTTVQAGQCPRLELLDRGTGLQVRLSAQGEKCLSKTFVTSVLTAEFLLSANRHGKAPIRRSFCYNCLETCTYLIRHLTLLILSHILWSYTSFPIWENLLTVSVGTLKLLGDVSYEGERTGDR